jgi:hypothetical protein
MAPRLPRPVFLAPASYRRKRVRDAARLLPLLGAVLLLLVPLLWTPSDEVGGVRHSAALIYVFCCWAALIVSAVFLSRVLRPEEGESPDDAA